MIRFFDYTAACATRACMPFWRTCSILFALTLLLFAHNINAAPGDLDTSFGTGGRVSFAFNNANAVPTSLAKQADGKVILAGYCNSGTGQNMCLLRLLRDGSADLGFGTEGRVTVSNTIYAAAITVQPDGKILLAGACNVDATKHLCAVRLQPNGALDSSFGVNGRTTHNQANGESAASGMILHGSGNITLSGICRTAGQSFAMCVVQFSPNGALDTNFTGGVPLLPDGFREGYARSVGVTGDGKLLLVGYCDADNIVGSRICAVRISASGSVDLTFGTSGFFTDPTAPRSAEAHHVTIQPDGKAVVFGACANTGVNKNTSCVVRLDVHGALDSTFGVGGRFIGASPMEHVSRFGALLRDGKLLVTGECREGNPDPFHLCFSRHNSDGSLDASMQFVMLPSTHNEQGIGAIELDGGKFLLASSCRSGENRPLFCLARFHGGPFANSMCSLDIDGDGLLNPAIDGLILARAILGFTGNAIFHGITMPLTATRTKWGTNGADDIRTFLISQCGMNL